jgi:hypothetical protein
MKCCHNCIYNEVPADDEPCCYCVADSEHKPDSTLCGNSADFVIVDEIEVPAEAAQSVPENDMVDHPSHYTRNPIEAIKAIEMILTEVYGEKGFEAYCFGNELKYRLRAGFKGDAQEDIGKALKYEEFRNRNFE